MYDLDFRVFFALNVRPLSCRAPMQFIQQENICSCTELSSVPVLSGHSRTKEPDGLRVHFASVRFAVSAHASVLSLGSDLLPCVRTIMALCTAVPTLPADQ